ncbi:ABC transporter permease [Paenibacillus solani]|uniref:ABC transporter permease n=1 Tax=Paenibacillus solani TaxID=1705565 RepID=UPI003D275D5B
MEYRADFFISIVGILIENTIAVLFYSIIFTKVPSINGWTYHQLLFMYGFLVTCSSIFHIFCGNLFQIKGYLRSGSFIKFYFRPANILFSYISETIDIKSIFQFMIGVVLLAQSSIGLGMNWALSDLILLILLILTTAALIISLMTTVASLGFWVRDPSALMDFMMNVRSYSRYPLSIYNRTFQLIFSTVVPVGFMAYYPSLIFLTARASDNLWIIPTQLVMTALFGSIAVFVFHKGTKRYAGTGS